MDDSIAVLPAGEPPGFPECAACPYWRTGPAHICVACATRTLEAIAARACPVCSQRLEGDSNCRNSLCRDPNRRIEHIDAIAYHSGPLQDKIHRYKYDGRTGWSLIFGRLVVGWLEEHAAGDPPDLIVANPTYVSPGQQRLGHIEQIIAAAAPGAYDRPLGWREFRREADHRGGYPRGPGDPRSGSHRWAPHSALRRRVHDRKPAGCGCRLPATRGACSPGPCPGPGQGTLAVTAAPVDQAAGANGGAGGSPPQPRRTPWTCARPPASGPPSWGISAVMTSVIVAPAAVRTCSGVASAGAR